jgi:hypothetical protein
VVKGLLDLESLTLNFAGGCSEFIDDIPKLNDLTSLRALHVPYLLNKAFKDLLDAVSKLRNIKSLTLPFLLLPEHMEGVVSMKQLTKIKLIHNPSTGVKKLADECIKWMNSEHADQDQHEKISVTMDFYFPYHSRDIISRLPEIHNLESLTLCGKIHDDDRREDEEMDSRRNDNIYIINRVANIASLREMLFSKCTDLTEADTDEFHSVRQKRYYTACHVTVE